MCNGDYGDKLVIIVSKRRVASERWQRSLSEYLSLPYSIARKRETCPRLGLYVCLLEYSLWIYVQ